MIRDFFLPMALLSLAQLTFCHEADKAPGVVDSAIPIEMRGRWGLTAADCDVTRDDATGAMLVSAEMLGFYDSRARLGDSHEVTPHRIDASYSFAGDGMTWTRDMTLSLSGDGSTLTRTFSDPDAGPVSLKYGRCG
ncbi:hypothetical protein AL036_01260 [Salipiger aestuarii]|uniref:hypothetical protein n=1 Tax=Salipiger aestuarii TaxID=568098 RepID=UPI0012385720|nr:hypothetical protein [Salipiger aestuarii]KAA8610125.1 hypothetical protein AL036_01260 [Salipiger aestuarii]